MRCILRDSPSFSPPRTYAMVRRSGRNGQETKFVPCRCLAVSREISAQLGVKLCKFAVSGGKAEY